jgi:hypothetical protein
LIPQYYSWGKLMVSAAAMEALLAKLEAFPPIFDMIEAFGERTGPTNESLGGFQVIRRSKGRKFGTTSFVLGPALAKPYYSNKISNFRHRSVLPPQAYRRTWPQRARGSLVHPPDGLLSQY